jgi:hypothetical protein
MIAGCLSTTADGLAELRNVWPHETIQPTPSNEPETSLPEDGLTGGGKQILPRRADGGIPMLAVRTLAMIASLSLATIGFGGTAEAAHHHHHHNNHHHHGHHHGHHHHGSFYDDDYSSYGDEDSCLIRVHHHYVWVCSDD